MGGFRLVRLLGAGTRSRVFLAHDGERAVALKVYRPGATPESIDDEIAALSSASHAHIVTLREVGTAPSGVPFLVLERLEATSLSALLASRGALGAGEAVTVLAPIVAAVGALHSSGVAHGSIGVDRVLFRATGAPVLTGLGRATLFVPPSTQAMLSTSQPVLEDRLALGRLVQAVAAHVDRVGVPLSDWLTALERDGFPDGFTEQLLDRVFGLGQAAPVRFTPSGAIVVATARVDAALVEPVEVRREATAKRFVGSIGSLVGRLPGGEERVRAIVESVRTVRRPVWIAAAIGASSLVAALLLAPSATSESAAEPPATAAPPTSSVPVESSPITEDDPVAAVAVLVSERGRCIRDLSVLCLERVDQSGSAALDDDVAVIRSIESGQTTGTDRVVDASSVELVERHGDAALVSYTRGENSEPASLLLVKGEAGWRFRDYLTG